MIAFIFFILVSCAYSEEKKEETIHHQSYFTLNTKRLIKCSKNLYQTQRKELSSHHERAQQLKLELLLSKERKGCYLIGLDGEVKKQSSSFFPISELEKIINAMPIRQQELKEQRL